MNFYFLNIPLSLIIFTFFSIGVVAFIIRIIRGFQLNVYLISEDVITSNGNIGKKDRSTSWIPLTSELKKHSFWRTFINQNWREDLEITLTDFEHKVFIYKIGYHVLHGFSICLTNEPSIALLNGKPMTPHIEYYLKTETKIKAGTRDFKLVIKSNCSI
jgi:hypothetical protein